MKKLHAQVDFGKDEMVLFQEGVRIPLQVNEAGQYVVPVPDKEPVEPPVTDKTRRARQRVLQTEWPRRLMSKAARF